MKMSSQGYIHWFRFGSLPEQQQKCHKFHSLFLLLSCRFDLKLVLVGHVYNNSFGFIEISKIASIEMCLYVLSHRCIDAELLNYPKEILKKNVKSISIVILTSPVMHPLC